MGTIIGNWIIFIKEFLILLSSIVLGSLSRIVRRYNIFTRCVSCAFCSSGVPLPLWPPCPTSDRLAFLAPAASDSYGWWHSGFWCSRASIKKRRVDSLVWDHSSLRLTMILRGQTLGATRTVNEFVAPYLAWEFFSMAMLLVVLVLFLRALHVVLGSDS